ncbi:glycosyltransferase [Microbacterium arborescens]|uniref:glycosyltransferase n=1 Tax=Microbacterium arborescens TaxID=33883 RepID=UPI000DF81343|nr:glycosyltransferase [Microbacterium arborescens]
MRIQVVSRIYAPEPAAASLRLSLLVRELDERGHHVEVLTSRAPRSATSVRLAGRVRRWPVLRDRSGQVRGYLPYLSFDIPAFFRVLLGPRADVVVVEPPPTTGTVVRIASAIRRVPYVYYAADLVSVAAESTSAPRMVVRLVRALETWSLGGARAVLAVTAGVEATVRALTPGAHVTAVGHGVDDETFHPAVTPDAAAHVVYIGTASQWHGAGVFVDALAVARSRGHAITALFVGQGGEWDQLKARTRQLGLDDLVRFREQVPAPEAARLIRGARAALASIREGGGYEFAVPTKAYAALAVGTPVVYAGPDPVRSLVVDNDLGAGTAWDVEPVAAALIETASAEPSAERRAAVAAWAARNLSGRAVARRAADVTLAAADDPGFTRGRRRRAR